MAVRQYVGARYVLKIYQNSVDPQSADWESGVSYEPLTMVNYNNSSYISRSQVPASVGDPVSNPTYWALSGLYNGQIAQLQRAINNITASIGNLSDLETVETDSIVDSINSINKRKFIFLTDSYGTFHRTDDGLNYVEYGAIAAGYTENEDFYQFYQSGCGFCAEAPHQFLDLLRTNETGIDKETITDIVVLGSANDQLGTFNSVRTAITSFRNYVRSNYPNAKLHIGCISKSLETETYISALSDVYGAYHAAIDFGVDYIENSEFAMTRLSYFRTDALHPNEDGILALGRALGQWLKTGNFKINRMLSDRNILSLDNSTYLEDRTGVTQPIIREYQDNGTVTCGCSGSILRQCSMKTSKMFAAGTTVLNNEIEIIDSLFYPQPNNVVCWSGCMWHDNDRFGVTLVIKPDDIATNSKRIKCNLIIENTTGSGITIASGENVSLLFAQPLTVTM